jgi:hypothetical protein
VSEFFKSLFRGHTQNPNSVLPKAKQISDMSFTELLATSQAFAAQDILPIMRRFYRIALFDNHVPEEHRNAAITLAEACQNDLEKSLSNNPQAVTALRTEIDQLRELARQGGYGSLVWRLNEYPMSGADTIPYIMRPEHRHLVPDYLTTITPEGLATVHSHLVRELVLQSGYKCVAYPV